MDKEKEIKELKNILLENKYHFIEENLDKRYTKEAIILISLGYGNVKQAVKEFAERLKNTIEKSIVCYPNEESYGYNNALVDVAKYIDNLIVNLYGVGE